MAYSLWRVLPRSGFSAACTPLSQFTSQWKEGIRPSPSPTLLLAVDVRWALDTDLWGEGTALSLMTKSHPPRHCHSGESGSPLHAIQGLRRRVAAVAAAASVSRPGLPPSPLPPPDTSVDGDDGDDCGENDDDEGTGTLLGEGILLLLLRGDISPSGDDVFTFFWSVEGVHVLDPPRVPSVSPPSPSAP